MLFLLVDVPRPPVPDMIYRLCLCMFVSKPCLCMCVNCLWQASKDLLQSHTLAIVWSGPASQGVLPAAGCLLSPYAAGKAEGKTVYVLAKDVPKAAPAGVEGEVNTLELVAINQLEGDLAWYGIALEQFYAPCVTRRDELQAPFELDD